MTTMRKVAFEVILDPSWLTDLHEAREAWDHAVLALEQDEEDDVHVHERLAAAVDVARQKLGVIEGIIADEVLDWYRTANARGRIKEV
jgi:hypothetical protein